MFLTFLSCVISVELNTFVGASNFTKRAQRAYTDTLLYCGDYNVDVIDALTVNYTHEWPS